MRWLDVKHGTKEDRRQWLKLHLMVGVKTNIVEVSDGYAHDYPFYKGLVDRTADAGFQMKEVSADKGYLGGQTCWGDIAARRGPLHPVQIKLSPAHERLRRKVGTVDAHVPLLRAQPG